MDVTEAFNLYFVRRDQANEVAARELIEQVNQITERLRYQSEKDRPQSKRLKPALSAR